MKQIEAKVNEKSAAVLKDMELVVGDDGTVSCTYAGGGHKAFKIFKGNYSNIDDILRVVKKTLEYMEV